LGYIPTCNESKAWLAASPYLPVTSHAGSLWGQSARLHSCPASVWHTQEAMPKNYWQPCSNTINPVQWGDSTGSTGLYSRLQATVAGQLAPIRCRAGPLCHAGGCNLLLLPPVIFCANSQGQHCLSNASDSSDGMVSQLAASCLNGTQLSLWVIHQYAQY